MPRAKVIASLSVGVLTVAWGAWSWAHWSEGANLYAGHKAVAAHIAGHDDPLPAQAAACVNCHDRGPRAGTPIAPPLIGATLTQTLARRGGPPSRYDRAAFCKLLRTGIDPAFVLVPRTMPRFEISDADCATLWNFVSTG